MSVFLLRRISQSFVLVAVVSALVFVAVFAIGNPIYILISDEATEQEMEAAIHALGLDLPLWQQYFVFIGNAIRGDLGTSFIFNEPAMGLIIQRFPATLELALSAMLIAVVVGIPLGMWAGLKPDSLSGRTIMAGSILGFSVPTFWFALLMIMIFAVELGWLPSTGRGETMDVLGLQLSFLTLDGLRHLILPAISLGLYKISLVIRLTRAGTLEVKLQDYIKFARAKGLSAHRIIFIHVLKNILIPVVTVLGLELGSVIAFAVVAESIFSWPGMGKLLIESINLLDRPVIVAYLMFIVLMFVVINLIVDIIYSALDPRVRLLQVQL
jgi:peptide/nickel transport system permease protein